MHQTIFFVSFVSAGCAAAIVLTGGQAWGQSAPPAPSAAPAGGVAPSSVPVSAPATAADTPSTPASTGGAAWVSRPVHVLATDGAQFNGTLVEEIPGQYVTILLATGEARKIAWSAIAKISQGDAEPSPSQSLGVKGLVRFDADDPRAQLEKFVGEWAPVCATPCEGELSLDGSYRIGGEGIHASEPFRLSARKVKIDASVGTNGRAVAGALLGIGGGVVAYIGALVFLFGVGTDATTSSGEPLTSSQHTSLRTTGGVMVVGGLALGVTGLVILLNNKTDVHVTPGYGGTGVNPRLKLAGPFELGPGGFRF